MASETNTIDDRGDDQRGAHRSAHGFADPGRAAGGGVAVVGVHQHDDDGHRDRLDERPDQVGRDQERVEVVVVDTVDWP